MPGRRKPPASNDGAGPHVSSYFRRRLKKAGVPERFMASIASRRRISWISSPWLLERGRASLFFLLAGGVALLLTWLVQGAAERLAEPAARGVYFHGSLRGLASVIIVPWAVLPTVAAAQVVVCLMYRRWRPHPAPNLVASRLRGHDSSWMLFWPKLKVGPEAAQAATEREFLRLLMRPPLRFWSATTLVIAALGAPALYVASQAYWVADGYGLRHHYAWGTSTRLWTEATSVEVECGLYDAGPTVIYRVGFIGEFFEIGSIEPWMTGAQMDARLRGLEVVDAVLAGVRKEQTEMPAETCERYWSVREPALLLRLRPLMQERDQAVS